jgi:hypothetical protein
MQTNYLQEQVIEERVNSVMRTLKRVAIAFFVVFMAVITLVLILEVKREYGIDLIKGVNFSIDDWYFDSVGKAVNSFRLF